MNREQNLKDIRKACITANPSIIDLKFGCETSKGVITAVFESQGDYSYAMTPSSTTWHGRFGTAEARRIPSDSFEIIGRPIRLADVLVAISKKLNEADADINGRVYLVGDDGTFGLIHTDRPGYEKYVNWQSYEWSLLDDSLNSQTDETLEAIANLLK